MTKKSQRRLIRKAVYILCIILLLLLVAEVVFQILRPYSLISYCQYISPDNYRNDKILGYCTAKNQEGYYERPDLRNWVVLNNVGTHDTFFGPKELQEYRILVIGGSFSANLEVAVEKTWPKLFEKMLQEKNKRVKVVNFANPAIHMNYFLNYFKFYSLLTTVKPDLIVSAFSFHRLGDYTPPPLHFHRYKGCVLLHYDDESILIGENIIQRRDQSLLFRMFKNYPLLRRSWLFRLAFQADFKRFQTPMRGNILFLPPAGVPEKIETKQVIAEVDRIAAEYGCPIAYYYMPHANGCNEREIRSYKERLERLFEGIQSRRRIVAGRLLESFKKRGRDSVYFPIDEHPNEEGIRCIAEEIYKDISAAGFVPLE